MKTLYYIEVAESIDHEGNLIPAKKMRWFTPIQSRIAYENITACLNERFALQERLKRYVVRIAEAGWFKNLWIRLRFHVGKSDWVIVEE